MHTKHVSYGLEGLLNLGHIIRESRIMIMYLENLGATPGAARRARVAVRMAGKFDMQF